MPILPVRPDIADTLVFVDEVDEDELADVLPFGDPTETPSLAEQRTERRKHRGVADVRKGAA